MKQIVAGLQGVLQIKDNILIYGKGKEHNVNPCLQRL